MDLFVTTHCPQCGADIAFEEESTVFYCDYCGSALHIAGRSGVGRAYVEPRQDIVRMKRALHDAMHQVGAGKALVKEKKLFFAPYWRVKAMLFRWIFGRSLQGDRVKQLKTKYLDQSFPAYRGIGLGLRSLGVRPGALKLRFFDSTVLSKKGSIMKIAMSFEDAITYGKALTDAGLDETALKIRLARTRLIGARYSIIYFPFWVIRFSDGKESRVVILDAVAHTATRTLTQKAWTDMSTEVDSQGESVMFNKVSFLPFKCPNCGWDLPLRRFDFVHLCGTCHKAWMEQGGRFRAMRFELAEPQNSGCQNLVYLPFWVFEVQIISKGQAMKTAGDLYDYSLMFPTRAHQETDGAPLRFFIPAVEIRNVAAANKLATAITNQQPTWQCQPAERLGQCKLAGAFLRPQAAIKMADILLCSVTPKNNQNRQDFLQDAKIGTSNVRLVWWPFFEQRLFLRDALCGCGIQKGTVALAY